MRVDTRKIRDEHGTVKHFCKKKGGVITTLLKYGIVDMGTVKDWKKFLKNI